MMRRWCGGDDDDANDGWPDKLVFTLTPSQEAGGLIDDKLTGRECKAMFVRVNLDDDLGTEVTADEDGNVWEQVEEGAATHSSSVMEYDEFEEVMARIANEKRGAGGEWAGSDAELAGLLVGFAEEALAPLKR